MEFMDNNTIRPLITKHEAEIINNYSVGECVVWGVPEGGPPWNYSGSGTSAINSVSVRSPNSVFFVEAR